MPRFRVGKPYSRVERTTDFTITATTQVLPWQTVQASEGEVMWSAAAPELVRLTRPGTWLLTAFAERQAQASADFFQISIQRGASINVIQGRVPTTAESARVNVADWFHTDVPLDVFVRINTGLGSGTIRQLSQPHLSAIRIGPERWTG